MLACLNVAPQYFDQLLDKLRLMTVLTDEGHAVASESLTASVAAAHRHLEHMHTHPTDTPSTTVHGHQQFWLERRLQRALEAEQAAADRARAYRSQCAILDEDVADMRRHTEVLKQEVRVLVALYCSASQVICLEPYIACGTR